MGILDKILPWKRDVGIKDEIALPPNSPEPSYSNPSSYPGFTPSYSPSEPRPFSDRSSGREMEIISARLDAIKAMLESINQRLANIERIANGETERVSHGETRRY